MSSGSHPGSREGCCRVGVCVLVGARGLLRPQEDGEPSVSIPQIPLHLRPHIPARLDASINWLDFP